MLMSLKDIKNLIDNRNTVFCQLPTSEGEVTGVVIQKRFQGLLIPVLTRAEYMGPVKINCGSKDLYVVKTGDKEFTIYNSKTQYLSTQKQ